MERTKLRKTYNILIRGAIVLLTLFFIYEQFHNPRREQELQSILDFFPEVTGNNRFYYLIVMVLLLPVNWMLEVVKWKLLVDKLEKVTLWNATKAVLTGISVSMFMPNRVGDYLGRVFVLKKADRLQAVLATIIGSLAQLITTILFGLLGGIMFYPSYFGFPDRLSGWLYAGLIFVAVVLAFTVVFAFLNFASFSDVIRRISGRFYRSIEKYAQVFSWYSIPDLLKILGISIGRYLVFSLQFYLLLIAFGLDISYPTAIMLIGLVYLAIAVIPTIALTELGVRGSVSIFIFALYFENLGNWSGNASLAVFSASGLLWLVNLAFPAFLGILFVYSLCFFRKINGNST